MSAEQFVESLEPGVRADLWTRFAVAQDAPDFLQPWLALQCQAIRGVHTALLLWSDQPDSFVPAAAWPDANRDLTFLAPAAERALKERRGVVVKPDDTTRAGDGQGVWLAYPCIAGERIYGAVVFDLAPRSDALVQDVLRQVHWGAGWLETLYRREQLDDLAARHRRAGAAVEMVAIASAPGDLAVALFGLVNALAQRFNADRVSIGLARKGGVRLAAISHSAWFDRRAAFVGSIENMMEEALDQGSTIAVPALRGTPYCVDVAHAEFSQQQGGAAVCSVLLGGRTEALGVLTIEARAGESLTADAVLTAEAIAELAGAVLAGRVRAHKWIAGRGVDALARTWNTLASPGRPALKLGLLTVALGIVALVFVEGSFRVTARSVVEGVVQRTAVAPHDGYVSSAPIRAGDVVHEGELLATLDDRDLILERVKWLSEVQQAEQKQRDAMARHDRPAAQILAAQGRQAQAQLDLVEERLTRTRVVAPIAGLVVTGDLSQLLGSPVQQGQSLFEIAPLDAYRVILRVDERDIGQVQVGQTGRLVLTGFTDRPLDFTVRKMTAVSQAQDGTNFFRVEAEVKQAAPHLRPGLEGVAKIDIDERRLIWIWTRSVVDWLRLALWRWWP